MSEQQFEPRINQGATSRVIYRRAADTMYVGAAIIAAFWAWTQWTQVAPGTQTSEAPLALTDVQFTAAGPMTLEIAADRYRTTRAELASALSATGANAGILHGLADSDVYFNLLDHAGTDFLVEKEQLARVDLAALRRSAQADPSPLTTAQIAVESARIDYYSKLVLARQSGEQ